MVKISRLFNYCREIPAGGTFRKRPRIIELKPSLAIFKLRESVGRAVIIIKRIVSWVILESLGTGLISVLWVLNSLNMSSGVRRASLRIILRFYIFKVLEVRLNLTKKVAFSESLRLFKSIKSMSYRKILD